MRVVVAMSGGVDSSAAAALLVEQGHEVLGITLRVWSYEGAAQCGSCCSPDDIDDARAVASTLGIPFYVANAEELFKAPGGQPFVQSYLDGKTPDALRRLQPGREVRLPPQAGPRARAPGSPPATTPASSGAATALRLLPRPRTRPRTRATSSSPSGRRSSPTLEFPVGGLTKAEVRAVAERHRLPTSEKPESMEICFVPDGDYAGFVEKVAGPQPAGSMVDERGAGARRGTRGVHRFTVGQRARPGRRRGRAAATCSASTPPRARWWSVRRAASSARSSPCFSRPGCEGTPSPEEAIHVRIRHRHAGTPARVVAADRARLTVRTEKPVRAVTPGQAAVFYRGDEVLGGGWIG